MPRGEVGVGRYKDMSREAQLARHPTWLRMNFWRVNVYVPGTRVMLLSAPEKMPGPSWSLPAGLPACPYMVTGPGTICGVCYAAPEHRGRYSQNAIVNAQRVRLDWTLRCMRSPEGRAEFVRLMVETIPKTGAAYMRVHDSGDLFSAAYTRCWMEICRALPKVRFWFPTRSWQAPWVDVLGELNALPNVSVRPSALMIAGDPPVINGLAAGTTAMRDSYTCPAPQQNNNCGTCRRCWDEPATPVSYHLH